jgi:hypothetical protein
MDVPASNQDQGRKKARLGRDIQIKIGQQLRAMYDELVNEGVPDRIADLLRKIEKRGDEEKN